MRTAILAPVYLVIALICFISIPAFSQVYFKGKVVSKNDNDPVMYATFGVKGKNAATVADSKGRFLIFLPRFVKQTDTVIISSIGYHTVEIPVSEALQNEEFKLEEKPKELPPVEVYSFLNRSISLSAFGEMSYFRGWYSQKTGAEIGKIIPIKHKMYRIDKVFFKVDNKYDTCLVRLHIRKVVNSVPGEELLTEEYILPIYQLTIADKPCEFDLTKCNMVLKESEVYVGFEVIECRSSSAKPSSLSFVGTESGEYIFKPYATSNWEKENNFTIYFGVGLQY